MDDLESTGVNRECPAESGEFIHFLVLEIQHRVGCSFALNDKCAATTAS